MLEGSETLREAARLMRERAEAATPGPWSNRRGPDEQVVRTDSGAPLARTSTRADRRHIASWHPVVALAVAGFLEAVAVRQKSGNDLHWPHPEDVEWAEQIARAYLGDADA